jgi:hypothetical protein
MHPTDVLRYGHLTVLGTIERFPESQVYSTGACGYWSVKDLVAHLGSFELVLVEVLNSILGTGETSLLEEMGRQGVDFNDLQVNRRKEMTMGQVFEEYESAHQAVMAVAARIPTGDWRSAGILSWYGEEYDLEDYIVYSNYAHKREHCGQIQVFSDQFK